MAKGCSPLHSFFLGDAVVFFFLRGSEIASFHSVIYASLCF